MLRLRDSVVPLSVSFDANAGAWVGAVICQRQPDGYLKPVAYAPGSLSPTEWRNVLVGKEALAITCSAERITVFPRIVTGTIFSSP